MLSFSTVAVVCCLHGLLSFLILHQCVQNAVTRVLVRVVDEGDVLWLLIFGKCSCLDLSGLLRLLGVLSDRLRHLMGLGLEHHVSLLVEGQVVGVLLAKLGIHLQEGLLLRLLEQVVLHGHKQIVQLCVRLLDDLDELALQVLFLLLDASRLVTLVVLMPVLFVMLLVVGVCGLRGMLRLHWLRLGDRLRLFRLFCGFGRVFGGDQCKGLLLLAGGLGQLG